MAVVIIIGKRRGIMTNTTTTKNIVSYDREEGD